MNTITNVDFLAQPDSREPIDVEETRRRRRVRFEGSEEPETFEVGFCAANEAIPRDEATQALHKYLAFDGKAQFALESFNTFMVRLPMLLESKPIQVANSTISITDVFIDRPKLETKGGRDLLPAIARRDQYTYSASVYGRVKVVTRLPGQADRPITDVSDRIHLFNIPVMVGSEYCHLHGMTEDELRSNGECIYDPLGYFIIKGAEKFILLDEKLRSFRPLIHAGKKASDVVCKMTCVTNKGSTVVVLSAEQFSIMKLKLRSLAKPINVFSFIVAAMEYLQGDPVTSDEILNEVLQYVAEEDVPEITLRFQETIAEFGSHPDNMSYIRQNHSKNNRDDGGPDELPPTFIEELIEDLFTHIKWDRSPGVSQVEGVRAKFQTLYWMMARYAEWLSDIRPPDNRDSWACKRLETPGRQFENLFNLQYKYVMSGFHTTLIRKGRDSYRLDDIISSLPLSNLSISLPDAFAPDSWGSKSNKSYREGVTDSVKRESFLNVYSQITKINAHASKQAKNPEIRLVQQTQVGYVDVIETQEGESVGINKHLAVGCYISVTSDENYAESVVRPFLRRNKSPSTPNPIVLNGRVLGFANAFEARAALIEARRSMRIQKDVCIVIEATALPTLNIFTDGARPTRPLLIVNQDTGRLVLDEIAETEPEIRKASFGEWIERGIVEYIDAWEQEWTYIAQSIDDLRRYKEEAQQYSDLAQAATFDKNEQNRQRALDIFYKITKRGMYTHCEIDPSSVLGYAASIIPFPNNSQAPRNTYQTGMGKQASGTYSTAMDFRFETTAKTLISANRPVVSTAFNQEIGLEDAPSGQMVILAVMSYYGWNQEDSIIVNKDAIDTGLFRLRVTKTFSAALETSNSPSEKYVQKFESPSVALTSKTPDDNKFQHLLPNGRPRLGAVLRDGDCVIGRTQKNVKTGDVTNASIYLGVGVNGVVHEIYDTRNAKSQAVMIVKIYEDRVPIVGDKFALRNAQKGTIGAIMAGSQMPFTEQGLSPSVIINPHSLPSRMTINMLLEMFLGKVAVLRGSRINASIFRKFDRDEFRPLLNYFGYSDTGKERMRSGVRGTLLREEVFIGPAYYQALRHHPKDKFQARRTGKVNARHRQPVQGRKYGGGIRVGEMERDALIGHGAANVVHDRLCLSSDAYRYARCSSCGAIPKANLAHGDTVCSCGGQLREVFHSYAFKYVEHILSIANIKMTSVLKDVVDERDGTASRSRRRTTTVIEGTLPESEEMRFGEAVAEGEILDEDETEDTYGFADDE